MGNPRNAERRRHLARPLPVARILLGTAVKQKPATPFATAPALPLPANTARSAQTNNRTARRSQSTRTLTVTQRISRPLFRLTSTDGLLSLVTRPSIAVPRALHTCGPYTCAAARLRPIRKLTSTSHDSK